MSRLSGRMKSGYNFLRFPFLFRALLIRHPCHLLIDSSIDLWIIAQQGRETEAHQFQNNAKDSIRISSRREEIRVCCKKKIKCALPPSNSTLTFFCLTNSKSSTGNCFCLTTCSICSTSIVWISMNLWARSASQHLWLCSMHGEKEQKRPPGNEATQSS